MLLLQQWGVHKGRAGRLGSLANTLSSLSLPPLPLLSPSNPSSHNPHTCSLLLRRECCSFSNGEYVKAGLGELDHWLHEATHEYTGNAWEELKYIRQAVGFLVVRHSHCLKPHQPSLPLLLPASLPLSFSPSPILPPSPLLPLSPSAPLPLPPPSSPLPWFQQVIHQKPKKSMQEITSDLCPALSIQQLYRISTMYWDDKYGTHTVSSEVISEMRRRMSDENSASVSNSFLLDDDSSIPFSVEDISKSTHEIDLRSLQLPPSIRDNTTFQFLLTH
ncbi:unnamed protein product [Closterium sp. NIES-54]